MWVFLVILLAMSKTDVKQWCTNNQYELLELEKTSKSEADDDDDADDDDENSHRMLQRKKRGTKVWFICLFH